MINLNTLLVEGILVAGDDDYEAHPNYPGQNRATNYPQEPGTDLGKGAGEVCTKISVPAPRIPKSAREKDTLKMKAADQNRIYPYLLKMLKKRAAEERNDIIPNIPRQPQGPVFI